MKTPLFTAANHEPLTAQPWEESRARAAIDAIVADAESGCGPDGYWPTHPEDQDSDGSTLRTSVYMGAAGIIWALNRLGRALPEQADALHGRYLAAPDSPGLVPGFWCGEAGVLLVAEQIAPTKTRAARLLAAIDANAENESNELMWGAPGTMLAARAMFESTGEDRWAEAWRRSAELLWSRWLLVEEYGCRLWKQRLYGSDARYIGPAHGFAGNVLALSLDSGLLSPERRAELERRAIETVTNFALVDGELANWPPVAEQEMERPGAGIRTQWCHGAPGIVTSLARVAREDPRLTSLLVRGGELTWRAGPLAKGAGLCHGTAGNGCAFLALYERTGDELWLGRARRFAVHALGQVETARRHHGFGRHSLWTGDIGVALFLDQCIEGRAGMPSLDLL